MTQNNRPRANLWTIILAAGEGTRLRPLTRAIHGADVPKQYASIVGSRSLLQATLSRTSRWSKPEHTVVVVAQEQESVAREQLRNFGDVEIVVQPKNRGTGPGLLLPLSHVLARDPSAMVAVMPSDHHVRDEAPLLDAVRQAETMARDTDRVVLIGATPEAPETQYGWIVADSNRVTAFLEKPTRQKAENLFARGALWNTFMMVGSANRFWQLGSENMPAQCARLHSYRHAIGRPWERRLLSECYDDMSAADFSRDVLERADALGIVRLAPCGWSDWGTPERVLASLEGTPEHARLSRRLREEDARRESGVALKAAS